jgi:hypothetical protein
VPGEIVHEHPSGPIVGATRADRAIDHWLDTLDALARGRVEQRRRWEGEARLRIALRERRGE